MPPLAARNSKLATRRTGATAVEFAIVAPIFYTLVIASLEFGRLNIIRHTADQAAYEAARFAMVPGATAAIFTSYVVGDPTLAARRWACALSALRTLPSPCFAAAAAASAA